MRAHFGGPFSFPREGLAHPSVTERAESAQEDLRDARHSHGAEKPLREQKPVRDFVDLKRDPPSLLTAVTREQPRIPEICRRCEIGTRLEI